MLIETEQRPHRLRPAGSDKSGEADDFAFLHMEGDVMKSAGPAEVLDFKNDVAVRDVLLGIALSEGASHHQGDDGIDVELHPSLVFRPPFHRAELRSSSAMRKISSILWEM